MKNLEILGFETPHNSNFLVPKRVKYVLNGKKRVWDFVESHDSVAILLYNEKEDSFVFVKQFRAPIYFKNGDGYTVELCAGIVDKDKSLEQIAIEEIEEETGYKVNLSQIEKITSFYTSVGIAGARQTLYFAKVDERLSEGGGIDQEDIEVLHVKQCEVKKMMFDEQVAKTSGLMYALMWFFSR